MKEETKQKSNKGITLLIIILSLISILSLGYIGYENFSSNNSKSKEKIIKEKETIPSDNAIEDLSWDIGLNFDEDKYKIYINTNNELIVLSKNGKKEIVAKDVGLAKIINHGQTDICYGQWLMIATTTQKILALSFDDLFCGDRITVKDLTEVLKINKINTVLAFYDIPTSSEAARYEPLIYNSYMLGLIDENQSKIVDLTDYLYR